MNLSELQNKINERAEEVKTTYLYDFKWKLVGLINEILKENEIEDVIATFDYGERMNLVKIVPKGVNVKFWPLTIEYKISRKTIKESYRGNEYEYTLKKVGFWNAGEREIAEEEVIKIESTEDFVKAEQYSITKRQNKVNEEKEQLKEFMKNNPEFKTMVEFYNKYKYQLD